MHGLVDRLVACAHHLRESKVADTADQQTGEGLELKERAAQVRADGNRDYNPGWHTALDLRSMLTVSESIATAALERTESRGGHTRDDYPATDPTWGTINLIVSQKNGKVTLDRKPLPEMPDDLKELFEESH